ncbi:hypothetical protein [Desertihabitans aurantiacus]|uniref:hypothetical protein n=1 Tax=Desertihabitans aurantiacus TaxID=2282477 RepID=UPI000DF7961D|nr:hypothetical protein [Desertihabitans aurantiacus]
MRPQLYDTRGDPLDLAADETGVLAERVARLPGFLAEVLTDLAGVDGGDAGWWSASTTSTSSTLRRSEVQGDATPAP